MTTDWQTPSWLFDKANVTYRFDVDAAASKDNTMVDVYWDEEKNAFWQDWTGLAVWCNPPYGRVLGEWIGKVLIEQSRAKVICVLVPSRTETKWWKALTFSGGTLQFIQGRVHFIDPTGKTGHPRFPSALWTLRPSDEGLAKIGHPICQQD